MFSSWSVISFSMLLIMPISLSGETLWNERYYTTLFKVVSLLFSFEISVNVKRKFSWLTEVLFFSLILRKSLWLWANGCCVNWKPCFSLKSLSKSAESMHESYNLLRSLMGLNFAFWDKLMRLEIWGTTSSLSEKSHSSLYSGGNTVWAR